MREIPRDGVPDSTLSFASDGYLFITKRCASLGTDLFRSRLMLQQTICMRGEESPDSSMTMKGSSALVSPPCGSRKHCSAEAACRDWTVLHIGAGRECFSI